MKFKVSTNSPDNRKNSCDVLVLLGKKKQTNSTGLYDKASGRAITRAVSRGDLTSDAGSFLVLHDAGGTDTERLLVVGAGDDSQMDKATYKKLCASVAKAVQSTGATDAVLHFVEELSVNDEDLTWQCQQLSNAFCVSQYRFTAHKQRNKPKLPALKTCHLIVAKQSLTAVKRAVKTGTAVADGMAVAQDLGNLAANICTPKYLATLARAFARQHTALTTKVLGEAQMRTLGMGAFLSVSQGSRQEAQLICMEYKGGPAKQRPVVLLGKGVTFDTGGISIKPSAAMDEMKFDMCGAASVFGAMRAICEIAPKCNVVGVIAAAENMPDGDASRPGDVVTSMSGQSIEILNTDAEGRLVLCDSLTYVERYKPAAVIDIATLTGACVVALGKVAAAVMANDDKLAADLLAASQRSQDLAWQLPLWPEYQPLLDSNFADMANIGGSTAGAITAGCFLSRFAEKYKWAHLDIAGVAWHGGENKGATGRPVPLLVQYILDHHALGPRA